jgi:hypothetical protein
MIDEENNIGGVEISLKIAVLAFIDAVISMNEIVVRFSRTSVSIRCELQELALFSCEKEI